MRLNTIEEAPRPDPGDRAGPLVLTTVKRVEFIMLDIREIG